MAVFTAQLLSGSTNGRPIPVTATASPGTTLHTVATAAGTLDELFIDAYNSATNDRDLVVEFGGTATAEHLWYTIRPHLGPYRIVAGARLTATGTPVRAFLATATAG